MLIGELSKISGFSRDTIRYYEKLGLLQETKLERQENNYKNYSAQALAQLGQIRHLKALGFTLVEVAELLEAFSKERKPCVTFPGQLEDKLAKLDEQIVLLNEFKSKLLLLRKVCDGRCENTRGLPDCFDA